MQQAWSFKSIEKDELRYWGNDGYHDDSSVFYRYDNFVANHKNVKTGDLVIITNRDEVLGVSIIEKITSRTIEKKRNKCPHPGCNAKKIYFRKKIKPEWRCDKNHEFATPKVIYESATEYIATYGKEFKKIDGTLIDNVISKTLRYNVQMSIQKINLHWASNLIANSSYLPLNVEKHDADTNDDTLIFSDEDQRRIVERHIKQRRGQKTFREQLLKYNPICAVTGCELVDILEAAHIDAYRNETHNHISNGVLLRSDIHTMFDLNLIAIHPQTHTIHLFPEAKNNGYDEYDGKKIHVKHKLSESSLLKRWDYFLSKS